MIRTQHCRSFRTRRLALTLAFVLGAPQAWAVDLNAEHEFDIPPQQLSSALLAFGRQSGIQVMTSASDVRAASTQEVRGRLTLREALARMLQGTGLQYRDAGENSITITPMGDDPGRLSEVAPTAAQIPDGERVPLQHGDRPGDIATLDRIVVTGTLLRGAAPTSPVVVITREDMERRGITTVQEALRQTSQNFSGINPGSTRATGGNTGFTSQANLRGLGPEATLTLVNGRRLTAAAGDLGRAVDLNFIPTAAVDRVEILTDGASALYGSDAIGGVVNLILREDFDGAEITAYHGENQHGADQLSLSGVAGSVWDGGNAILAVQRTRQRALEFARAGIPGADLRPLGGADYRLAFAGQPGNVLPVGYFAGQPFASLAAPDGSPVYFAAIPPGLGGDVAVSDLRLNTLNAGDILHKEALPESVSDSFYATVRHDFGAVELFADAVHSTRETRLSPSPYIDVLLVMPGSAYSPFPEPVLVGYLDDELGSDAGRVRNTGWAASAGARGELARSGWQWELVGTTSRDRSELRYHFVDPVEMAMRLASPDPAYAYNPFGSLADQAPGVAQALMTDQLLRSVTGMQQVSGLVRGDAFSTRAGTAKLAIGAEHRRETLDAGNVPDASREADAVFAELYTPLAGGADPRRGLRELSLSTALRWDRYSDFGRTLNPKVGLRWRPSDSVAVNAGYGTSFRAPNLSQLFFSRNEPRDSVVFDPNAPGGGRTVLAQYVQGGNPDLGEETAKTLSLGIRYTPAWLEGLRLGLAYFSVDYKNRIRGALDGIGTATLLEMEAQLPPGIVERDAAGNLTRLYLVDINSALTEVDGLDLSLGYTGPAGRYGSFGFDATATVYAQYEDRMFEGSELLDLAGRLGNPARWRGRFDTVWSHANLEAVLSINHVDGLRNEEADPRIVRRRIGSQTTVDLGLTARSPAASGPMSGLAARVGVKNLFGRESPFVDSPTRFGLDSQNYMIEGRTLYLSVSKAFGNAVR